MCVCVQAPQRDHTGGADTPLRRLTSKCEKIAELITPVLARMQQEQGEAEQPPDGLRQRSCGAGGAGAGTERASGQVCIGMLPATIEEEELVSMLQQYGNVTQLTLQRSPTDNGSKGVACVQFATRTEAAAAVRRLIRLNGHLHTSHSA